MAAATLSRMEEVICRVRAINIPGKETEKPKPVPLMECADDDIPTDLRVKWANKILKIFDKITPSADSDVLRPLDFLLDADGSVEPVAAEEKSSESGDQIRGFYPAPFSIPLATVAELDPKEIQKRAELFALGGLLYETISLKKPFGELEDEEIQSRYSQGTFPDDVWNMTLAPAILSCWSWEFKESIEAELASQRLFTRLGKYAREHPYQFGFQAVGGTLALASVGAVPVLGALGFSAVGPVAGSVAAGVQSSMGLVQAGSVFAWCQSVTMGGAAVGGLVGAGATGAGVAAVATVPAFMGPSMKERFNRTVRTAGKAESESKL
ncbi:hypothetical protein FQN54_004631 [Arachnomyces sp. PD_36]|nr:hypothetical protein FQN54_004631 [Arachnomyces sp. PD_36]